MIPDRLPNHRYAKYTPFPQQNPTPAHQAQVALQIVQEPSSPQWRGYIGWGGVRAGSAPRAAYARHGDPVLVTGRWSLPGGLGEEMRSWTFVATGRDHHWIEVGVGDVGDQLRARITGVVSMEASQ